MQCPFPGMDPYIERPAIWADFHDRLIGAIAAALQPKLKPKYVGLVQYLLFVTRSKRPIYPDDSIAKQRRPRKKDGGELAVLELDEPITFKIIEEEIRQPYLEIIETATGRRLTTAIEILSPDNKSPGDGRKNYLKKCREVRQARANLVEIDLLRAGKSTLQVPPEELAHLPSWHCMIGVLERPKLQKVYPVSLQNRLPVIGIPLGRSDTVVPLDLQAAFTRVWQEGPYPEILNYDGLPPGKMEQEEINSCLQRLREAGMRS